MRAQKGFTLIELMISVVIIGIIASIAYPSYQEYILQTWRTASGSCLLEMAQRMERRYTTTFSYVLANQNEVLGIPCATDNDIDSRYTFSFNGNPTATSFALRAAPKGAQSSDGCGTITVNQAGAKGVGGKTVEACW